MDMDADCLRIIRNQASCALATVSRDGAPHCSLMAYLPAPDGLALYVATLPNTRKYENLTAMPIASVLIDTRPEGAGTAVQALTLGCEAEELHGEERVSLIKVFRSERPQITAILDNPDIRVFALRIKEWQKLDSPTDVSGCTF